MLSTGNDYRWGAFGYSQLGASHGRQALPNQDSIQIDVVPDGSPPVIMSVSDGHGSAKCFRSHVGAKLAVESASQVCRDFLDGIRKVELAEVRKVEPSAVKNIAERQIPPRIFQMWKERVAAHFAENPFSEAELDRLRQQDGQAARDRAAQGQHPHLAYGATLLTAVLTNDYLLCFQLGDGEILAVSDVTGEVGRVVSKDESLIANETTSLCQEDASKYVRCQFQLFEHRPPGLVLLSTDGYPNSFASPGDFLKVGTDYLDLLRTDGADAVGKSLPAWLEQASREGSGDDVTLGIIYRREPPLARPAVQPPELAAPLLIPRDESIAGSAEAGAAPRPLAAQPTSACASMQAIGPPGSDHAPSQPVNQGGAGDGPGQDKTHHGLTDANVNPQSPLSVADTSRNRWFSNLLSRRKTGD